MAHWKKFLKWIGLAIGFVFVWANNVANMIGKSTTPEDANSLLAKIGHFLDWLTAQNPNWVLFIGVALLLVCTVLIYDEIRKSWLGNERPFRNEIAEKGQQNISSDVRAITPHSHKGMPLIKLSPTEQERAVKALVAIDDYLTNEFAKFLRPFQEMREAQKIIKTEGPAAYHAREEAPRPAMREFIDEFVRAMKPYEVELQLLSIDVTAIKTKATPLWDAVKQVSDVSQLLPTNPEPLKLPIRQLGEVVERIETEVNRVLNETRIWRLKISRGELG